MEGQRDFLEQTFGCRIYSWYGHSEKCILAGECEVSQEYHIFPQYGLAEIIDENGRPITEPGIPGRLLGTSFITFAMPFIRYLTDDWAQWAEGDRCQCGRAYKRITKVSGRWNQEVIVGKSGGLIPVAALNLHSAIYTKIQQFQFYQDEPGKAILRIVPSKSYHKDDDERQIMTEFRQKIGHDVKLTVEYVNDIPFTARRKFKFVDQRLLVTL